MRLETISLQEFLQILTTPGTMVIRIMPQILKVQRNYKKKLKKEDLKMAGASKTGYELLSKL